jgi:polyhydroxyalkanoate synthesis regulator phasin
MHVRSGSYVVTIRKGGSKMRKLVTVIVLAGFIALGIGVCSSYADEIDILLQKLVEKGVLIPSEAQQIGTETKEIDILLQKLVEEGVLTPGEAQQIGTETEEQVKKEMAEGEFSSLPQWVQNTKLKGDLRLRYQDLHDEATDKDTNIGRVRMRLGLESMINEKLLLGIRIATGSGDPRSTNISFGGYNSKKTIVLDYAYGKYSPLPWLNFVGGKMLLDNTLWEPTDLIWDTNITPEGAVIQLNKSLGPKAAVFMNTGALIVDTNTSSDNHAPMAYLIQPGINYKFNDDFSLKGALSLQSFNNVKNHVSSTYSGASNSGNTTAGVSKYTYNYRMINPALQFKIMQPFKAVGLNVESLNLFGEYVNNLDVSKKASGFSPGFQFGNENIEKWGDWQFIYKYAMLGKDAVLDVLPDISRYSGKTAIRSNKEAFNFGLGKNTFLGVDVYESERVGVIKAPQTLVQVDWNMKF